MLFGLISFAPSADASYIGWIGDNYVYCPNGDMNGCNGNGGFGSGNYNTNPTPYINSITPNSGNINESTTVTIYGSNFVYGSVARFNNVDKQTSYVNQSTLRVQLSSYDLANIGSYSIIVFNPGPGGGMSNAATFSITNTYNNYISGTTKTYTKTSSTHNTTAVASNTKTNVSNSNSNIDENSLAANAIFGAGSFVPTNFLQWLIVFILILLIVFLWRKIYVTDKERFVPLKHA